MARLIDPFGQFFDSAGDPLGGGKLYFYESGSSSALKDIFSDASETIDAANPVILNADGRCPNVFGSGSYRVILTDSVGSQIIQRDPVGGDEGLTFGADWNAEQIYGQTDVARDGGVYWISKTNNNQNNKPSTDGGVNWRGWPDGQDLQDGGVEPVKIGGPLTRTYTDSGVADAYVLTEDTKTPSFNAYTHGAEFDFVPLNTNTGAATANISDLEAKSIKDRTGADLAAGTLNPSFYNRLRYDSGNNRLEFIGIVDAELESQATTHNFASDANYTLTADQNLFSSIIMTDSGALLTVARNVTVSNVERIFLAKNSTAKSLSFGTLAGSSVEVLAGDEVLLHVTGGNVEVFGPPKLKRVLKITASGGYTNTTGARFIDVEGVGAGGGGAGVAGAGAGTSAAGGSGAAGGYFKKFKIPINSSYSATATIGAQGTGGAAGANNGTSGGTTSWTDGINTLTAAGGTGGIAITGVGTYRLRAGSDGGAASGGDVNIDGSPAIGRLTGTYAIIASYSGANSHFGKGGLGVEAISAATSGVTGTGYGSGGSAGATNEVVTDAAGGNGRPGIIIVTEYY